MGFVVVMLYCVSNPRPLFDFYPETSDSCICNYRVICVINSSIFDWFILFNGPASHVVAHVLSAKSG